MLCAFGDWGATGAKPPLAAAAPAKVSARAIALTAMSGRRTAAAFYGGGRPDAREAAPGRARPVRGLRQRGAAAAGRRLPARGRRARLPALARPRGEARLLALGVDVPRRRRHVPAERLGRRRLPGGRETHRRLGPAARH